MNFIKHVKRIHIVIILIAVLSFPLIHIAKAISAEPGTDANPLVSQDYVDSKLGGLSSKVDEIDRKIQNIQQAQGELFETVKIEPGKQLIAGSSAQLILRSGKAEAVGSANGGLSDVTVGEDIQTGMNIPSNHLLIVPRDDGRGLTTVTEVWILVKGIYEIK